MMALLYQIGMEVVGTYLLNGMAVENSKLLETLGK